VDTLENYLTTANACLYAYEGNVEKLNGWIEARRRGKPLPDILEKSKIGPLGCAVLGEQVEAVVLLASMCDINLKDKEGKTPLERAKDDIKTLLEAELQKE
jgi:hypothetical protein